MLNANEARKIMEKNSTRKNDLQKIVEKVMPVCEKHILNVVGFGGTRSVVTCREIMEEVGLTYFTKKEILDAIVNGLKGYGYKAETVQSYTSIHITW